MLTKPTHRHAPFLADHSAGVAASPLIIRLNLALINILPLPLLRVRAQ